MYNPFNYSQREQQVKAPPVGPLYIPNLPAPRESAYTPTAQSLLPNSQWQHQLQAPPSAPPYTPNVPMARESAYTPKDQSGYHPSLFPDVGTYSSGSGTPATAPNSQRNQSLFSGVSTYQGAPVPAPNQPNVPGDPSPSTTGANPSRPASKDPKLQRRGIPLAEPNPPTGLESTVNGILPSTQSLMSPMVYQRPNIYGNQGITRFDDSSGVPTFTNTGRAGYDQLQGGGGATNALPQQGAGQQTALEAMAIQPGSVGGTLQGIESQRTGNAGLYKARLAASMGLTEDQYDRVMAARQQDRDITALGRQGFSTREVAGLMGASAKNYGQGTLNAARTQEALAKARKAEAEAAGGDPKAGYYNARGTKEGALAQGAQLDNQTKMHLAQLQQQLLTETDPQRRKQLTDMILAIHGKVNQQPPEFRTIGLAGGTDELGNRLPGQPYTYSGFTGQPVTSALPGPQAKTSQGVPQDGVYDVPGVGRVLVRNGQTYDAKGNLIQ